MKIESIAKIVHESYRAYCTETGEPASPAWEDLSVVMKLDTVASVEFRLNNPGLPVSYEHNRWLQQKLSLGWKYGPVKDAHLKTNPNMVAFEELPVSQRAKIHLAHAVIDAISAVAI